jgi:hypothetical protein
VAAVPPNFDLRKFRSAVRKLKAQGILKNVDVRRAQPFWIRQERPGVKSSAKPLSEIVDKWDAVVSDKAAVVHLAPEKVRQYKKAGYETTKSADGAVVVPKLKTDRVTVEKGEIKIKAKGGVEKIKKAVPFQNLEQWLREMKQQSGRLQMMKRKNEYWGYTFAGSHGDAHLYSNIEDLFDDIINGTTSGLTPENFTTYKMQHEFYEDLVIVRVPAKHAWNESPASLRRSTTHGGRGWTNKSHREYVQKIRKSRIKGDKLRAAEAERKRRWRASLSPSEKEKYLSAGRKRSKKAAKRRRRAAKRKK